MYNEYYLPIKRNEFQSAVVRWMNLEPAIYSEISQKDKTEYCILIYTCGIQKSVTDKSICREGIGDADEGNALLDAVQERDSGTN